MVLANNIRRVLPQREEWESQQETTDLQGLVSIVVETLKARASKLDVEIEWNPGVEHVIVEIKKSQFFMALLALADNAIRAATVSEKGFVSVELTASEQEIHIEIRNNGDRVPANKIPYLFKEPFTTRSHASRPGTGLGLILASHWIEDNGGKIEHQYDYDTGTTTFRIIGRWANCARERIS